MFPVDISKLIYMINQIETDLAQKQDLLNQLHFENSGLLKQLDGVKQSIELLQQQLNSNNTFLENLEESHGKSGV
ncbi:MAG: hypothetical protein K2Y14_14205 [Burkholderiales bacterium]|nr:hypothetical protein [Burkholderiales bacterium]